MKTVRVSEAEVQQNNPGQVMTLLQERFRRNVAEVVRDAQAKAEGRATGVPGTVFSGPGITASGPYAAQLAGRLGQSAAPRTFTREEILTVLKAQKVTWRDEPTEIGGIRYRAALQALDDAMGIFERME